MRHCAWVRFPIVSLESFRPRYGPGVGSAFNLSEYQEYFLGFKGGRCLGLTTLPPSCADHHEIWEPQPRGTLRASPGLYEDCFTFTFTFTFTFNRSLRNLLLKLFNLEQFVFITSTYIKMCWVGFHPSYRPRRPLG